MKAAAAIFALFAGPAFADGQMLAFLAGHGCTVGPESRAAGAALGLADSQIMAFAEDALQSDSASRRGDYIVLGPSLCTIELPDIEAAWTLDDPRIASIISDADADPDNPGCYLLDLSDAFIDAYPNDMARANEEFIAFLGRHIASGEVRFYSDSPLRTPVSFQVVRGACAEVPNIDDLVATHAYVTDTNFDQYVRASGKDAACEYGWSSAADQVALEVQGIDLNTGGAPDHPVNAMLGMEFMFLAWAAGFLEDATMQDRGSAT